MKKNGNFERNKINFSSLSKKEKELEIKNIFCSVSLVYDLMNDIMSFGIHRIWKKIVVEKSNICIGQNILDLAGGTGDLSAKFSRLVGTKGKVILADINESMIRVGRDRLRNYGILGNIFYVQTNAEELPFPDKTFDRVIISFGLRNILEKEKALHSIRRVLKIGGYLLILEFSKPSSKILEKIYDFYSFQIIPLIGKIFAGNASSYRYLVQSIRLHPDQEQLKSMMLSIGFREVEYFNLSGGIVAIHRGYRT